MKNIITILTEQGIDLTDEQKEAIQKTVAENYKTVAEFDKKINSVTSERDTLKNQYDEVKKSLDGFNGVDVDDLRQQIADANAHIKEVEDIAKQQMAERDYADAVKAQVESLAFSSNGAKKSFIADLTATKLPLKDGKLLGFDDYVKAYKESDVGAIIDKDASENKAKFTKEMGTDQKSKPNDHEIAAVLKGFGIEEDK